MAKTATPKSSSPVEDSQTTAEGMSKSEAARAAIDQGIENPTEASQFILKRYGIEMTPSHFSAVKSQYKKATEAASVLSPAPAPAPTPKAKPGRKPKAAKPAVEGYLAPPPKKTSDGGLLDAMETMKPLIASLGAEKVKRIVDLLG